MVRRVGVLLAVTAVLLGMLSASWAQQRTERLTVAFNAFENNITPFTLTMQGLPNTPDLVNLVYDTLFWSAVAAEPDPWLAESAEPNDDFTVWTVRLRDDVTWHDGEPFTAEDVAFTFRYFTDVHRVGRYAHHVYDIPPFESAEVVDDHTVELRFAAPAPTFKLLPGGDVPIVPAHVWSDIDDPATRTQDLPVGTGPLRLVEIVPDQLYRFQANDDYFLGAPAVEELVLPIVRDPSAVFAGLRTGELDSAVHPVPPELVEDFEANEDITLARSSRMETVILFFNTREGPGADVAVRRAIARAIDRDEIVDRVMLGHAQPGRDSFTHPEAIWALPDGIRHDGNPEEANEILEEAGYVAGDDGMRTTPDGAPLSIEVLVSSFQPQHQRALEIIADQVAEVGIDLRFTALDPASIAERRRAEPPEVPDNEAYVWAMESHMHADPDAMIHFFGSPQPGRPGGFFTGYANPEFDALAHEAAVETDPDARMDKIHDLQRMFAEDLPAIVLYYPDGIYAYRHASYDGWVEDPGHGIFTKRSFLSGVDAPDPAVEATPDDAEEADDAEQAVESPAAAEEGGLPWAWILLLVVAVAVAVALARRRTVAEEDE